MTKDDINLYACFKCGDLHPIDSIRFVNMHEWNPAFGEWAKRRIPVCSGCFKFGRSAYEPVGYTIGPAVFNG